MTLRFVLAAFLVLSAASAPVRAQGIQTGTIRGAVADPDDLPVPDVAVVVTSPALQGGRRTTTGMDGTYAIHLLPPGEYVVRFQIAAFDPVEASVTVPLGGEAVQDARLRAAAVKSEVDVAASTPGPLATPSVGLNIRRPEVEALATSRTLQGIATLSPGVNENSPNVGQLVINGALAFDNVFMINGVDVNDNVFGNPQDLFIEDAIEETQVLTSGIPAEYGRFSGGAVVAVTRNGGNVFSGSFRVNLTDPAWTDETPFEVENGVERQGSVNRTYEATLGGPVRRDALWFFGAWRRARQTTSETFPQTGIPFALTEDAWRGEVKITGTPAAGHTVQGGFLNNSRELRDKPGFTSSIDPATLTTQREPNWYAFGNYRGVPRGNLLAETQFSERRFTFEGVGGTSTALVDSPIFTATQDSAHYNAPYFDATDPEERNNRQLTGAVTYFFDAAGRHEAKGGYEWFRSQNRGGNSQSSTSYVFDTDYATDVDGNPLLDASGRLIPVFAPFESFAEHWIAQRGATLNVNNHSFYAQDRWAISGLLTANLGLRYERVRSEATGNIVGVDTDTVVPRLALAYDVKGDGRLVLHTTYGHYAGRYSESQIGVNTNVGNPDETFGVYLGPPGEGRDFAPGFDPDNYLTVLGIFPTVNVFVDKGLSSPITKEFTVSGGASIGARAYGEATYVWRNTSNFIEDFIESSNGTTDIVRDGLDFGTFTNIVYRNTDEGRRRYRAAIFQGRYAPRSDWTVHGSWTLQLKNEGNYVGEAPDLPGIPSPIGDYPEAFNETRHFPFGRLPGFQRHRVRLWTIYDVDAGRYGDLSVSGLWRIESGRAYNLAATGVLLTPIQMSLLQDYVDAPFVQDLFFGERGAGAFPGYGALDTSVNYAIPVFRSLRPWVKFDIFNLLNNDKLIGFNTTVVPNTDPGDPVDALGLPTTFTEGPNFGEARGTRDFPRGRTFRVAFGMRF